MLLIFGIRVRFSTVEQGDFFCPQCGGDRHFARRRARRWFTLFFIPLIPLNVVGEVVECSTCHTRFNEGVLAMPTTASMSTMLDAAVRVATAAIVQTGDVTNTDLRETAVSAVRSVGVAYDDETLVSAVGAFDRSQLGAYLEPLAPGLDIAGKERFVADLVRVAWAGGALNGDQRNLIDTVGRSLGLTPAHVAGIVATTSRGAGSSPPPPPPPANPATEHPSEG